MPVSSETTNTLMKALDAARGVRHAGDGLVVVLLRGDEAAAALHWPIGGTITTPVGGVAKSLATDRAVLVVVGSFKVVAAILRASDLTEQVLRAAGVSITARVHVSALSESAIAWKDLSETAQDGTMLHVEGGRRSGPLWFRRRR